MDKNEYFIMLAAMDDDEFRQHAASLGFTPKPGVETMSNFRTRVVEYLQGAGRNG